MLSSGFPLHLEIPLLMSDDGLDSYITKTIAPLLYYKFNEASGDLIDYGSEGANGTVSGATQGQTGQLGENEAYSFDGVDDVVIIDHLQLPNVKTLTTQRWAFLANATSLGEGNSGKFLRPGNPGHAVEFASTNRLQAYVAHTTTWARSLTVANAISDIIGSWAWVFMDYDNDDELGNGRVIRLFKGISSTLTQLTLGTEDAAVGTTTVQNGDYNIGNQSDLTKTFDGLMDIAIIDSGLWTTTEMQKLIDLSGV